MTNTSEVENRVRGRWAVVLAGGAGKRLESLTTDARGAQVPKQYCALRGERSLLQMALARAERLVPEDRVLVVVQRDHRSWWARELAHLPPGNVVVQPGDRGTAVGLLSALLAIRVREPEAEIAVLPADHFVAREELLVEGVEVALAETAVEPRRVVLLATACSRPDGELGWIVPAAGPVEGVVLPVAEFREKPSAAAVHELVERGALVNCFVAVGRLQSFLRLFAGSREARERLEPLFSGSRPDPGRLAAAYERLPRLDLSADVFEKAPAELAVLPLPELGWTDLGTPASVQRCLSLYTVPVLPPRAGCRAPVDLSAPRPASAPPVRAPAPELSRYAEML